MRLGDALREDVLMKDPLERSIAILPVSTAQASAELDIDAARKHTFHNIVRRDAGPGSYAALKGMFG